MATIPKPGEQSFIDFVREFLRPMLEGRRLNSRPREIVVEFNAAHRYHVAASILATALAVERNAAIAPIVYASARRENWRQLGNMSLGKKNSEIAVKPLDELSDIDLNISVRRGEWRRAKAAVQEFALSRPTSQDLSDFTIADIRVGEAVLDKCIRKLGPEVLPDHPVTLASLERLSAYAIAARRFVRQRRIQAVVSIDIAYKSGILLKAGILEGVETFIADQNYLIRLSKEFPYAGRESRDFAQKFYQLHHSARNIAIARAGLLLSERGASTGFTATGSRAWGEVSSGLSFGEPEGWTGKTILVSAHGFVDAQHACGPFLFSDFFSWLQEIRKMAEIVPHRWLIKLHPDDQDVRVDARRSVERLFANQQNVYVLPDGLSNTALIQSGVNLLLTIYGTAALEYPWAGIPAITAHPTSVHGPFGYALSPQTLDEWRQFVLTPAMWDYRIPREDILIYSAMQYVSQKNLISSFLREDSGFSRWPGPETAWRSLISPDRFASQFSILVDWLHSGEYSANHYFGRQELLANRI